MKVLGTWGPAALVSATLFTSLVLAAPNDTPASEKSIRQLIDITQASKLLDNLSGQLDTVMQASMKQALAGQAVSAEQQAILDEMRVKTVKLISESMQWNRFEPMFIDIYKKSFTQHEIDGMLAFYKTEAGKALIVKMPLVMQNTMQATQSQMATIAPQLQLLQRETIEKLKSTKPQ